MGWGDLGDGALLGQMADLFDALVTVDKNIPAQQNIRTRSFGVIILRAKTNRLADLIPLVPELRSALEILMPGDIRELGK